MVCVERDQLLQKRHKLLVNGILAGDVQTVEGTVGNDRIDIFVFQFQLSKTE